MEMRELANFNFANPNRIGFMQGRLSPIRNGRIQSFPWDTWGEEFEIASNLTLEKMEWTIDSENFTSNPILTSRGQAEINRLKELFHIEIPSVTCDYFMENPPWQSDPEQLSLAIESILHGMSEVNAKILVIPLVDNSSLGSSVDFSQVELFFGRLSNLLYSSEIRIAFETDLSPSHFSSFIRKFDSEIYGVNYDIGNSASFGFQPIDEFEEIGARVINVHVKDRALGGSTVPLGSGDADFPTVFQCLKELQYVGNLIMQTARAEDDKHADVLAEYRGQIAHWIEAAQ
jgi:L-ribulose-5-phosphate 3-epimerase